MKTNGKNIISDLLFYGVLIALVLTFLAISSKNSTGPRVVGGYSAFVVLTGSMQDVIPKGSLVITQHVDPNELEIGDDITYMISEKTTVTHRIIKIEEEYLDTGERAFTTKGTMNAEADRTPVAAVNVVGKVIYHSEHLGAVISFGQENWPLIVFFIVVALIFIKIVGNILEKEEPEDRNRPNDAKASKETIKAKKVKKAKKQKETKKTNEINEMVTERPSETKDEDGFTLEIIDL